MKDLLFRCISVFSILLMTLAGCQTTTPTAVFIPAKSGKFTVSTDPRLELMAVLLSLFDYTEQAQDPRLMADVEFDYKSEVEETFGSFRDHPAVKLLREITPARQAAPTFHHQSPPLLMLFVTDPPELALRSGFEEDPNLHMTVELAGGQENVDKLLSAMRDFALKTNFMKFYDAHQGFYQEVVAQVTDQFTEQDLSAFEAYYGVPAASYQVKLVPLFGKGSFGPSLPRSDGSPDVYFILGTQGVTEQKGPLLANPQTFRHQLWHEFGHSFVNPLLSKNVEAVRAYEYRYEPIAEEMTKIKYGNWFITVNEHIVRSVVIRLAYQVEGKTAGDALLADEQAKGFAYIDPLLKKLDLYEHNRDQYPTFESFYLELIKGFGEQK